MPTTLYGADRVICDLCGHDHTDTGAIGGLVFNRSTAVCPDCCPRFETAIEPEEVQLVTMRAAPAETFAALVLRFRAAQAAPTGSTRRKRHPSVTAERVMEMWERRMTSLDNPGICFACGAEADAVEPDARRYQCEACGEPRVYGCEEAALMLL